MTWLAISATTIVVGTEISNRFASIPTFTDDRYVGGLNENFRRLTQVFTADGDFNVVFKGTSSIITLHDAQTNSDYGVFVQTSWASTMTAVLNKTTESFKVEASTPGNSAGGTLDWALVR